MAFEQGDRLEASLEVVLHRSRSEQTDFMGGRALRCRQRLVEAPTEDAAQEREGRRRDRHPGTAITAKNPALIEIEGDELDLIPALLAPDTGVEREP